MADEFDAKVAALQRRFAAMTPAVRKAAGQEAFMQAEDMAAEMRRIAPYHEHDDGGEHVRDRIRVEEGRLGDISYVVISDAKDAQGRAKASRVELGHTAADGTQVPAQPSFYPVVRVKAKTVKRRLKAAMRKAIRKEAGL